MADELWTPEAVAKFKSLPSERQTSILDQLSDEEFSALQAKMKPAAPAPAPVKTPDMLKPGMPAEFNDLGVQLPEYGPPGGVGEQILSGVKSALDPREQGITDILRGPASKVAEAVVQPLKKAYVDPTVKQWQGTNRAQLEAAFPNVDLEKSVGTAGGQALRNLGSLLYGPPETYRTPEQQAAGARALAEAGEKWLNPDMPSYKGPSANPEASAGGAFANTFTAEAANLPLYLIPGLGKSGAVQGATAGFASDLLDPREGANPVMAAAGGAALGGAFDAVPHIAREAKALIQSKTAEWAAKAEKQVVVPAAEVKTLVEAPVTGELKAGAKVSYYEARKNPHGGVDYSPVQISPAGKKVGKPVTIAADDPARVTQDLRGKPVVAVDEVGAAVDALRPKQRQVVLDAADEGDVLLKEGDSYRTAFDDEGTLRLDALPEGDFLVGRTTGDAPVEFKRVKLRNLQVESLRRRSLVTVETPEGPRLGWDRSFQGPDGKAPAERLIVPVNPKERIPNALEAPITAPASAVKTVTSTDEFNKILDARERLIRAEEEALLDAADAQIAAAADAAGAPVVMTDHGPKVALVGDDVPPGQPPPEPPPPGFPPNGDGGDFGGVPLPPTPPNPAIAIGLDSQISFLQRALSPNLIPPTASGALDASTAATFFASSRNADAIQGNIEKASQKLLRPVVANLPEARRAALFRKTTDFLEGRINIDDLTKAHPEIAGEIENLVVDARKRHAANQQFLEAEGFVHPLDFATPGGQMAKFVEDVKLNRTYLARRYYAYDLEAGKWADYVKRNDREWGALIEEYDSAVLVKRKDLEGLTKQERRAVAERELETYLRDPDAIAEAWNTQHYAGGLKGADASDALKARAGHGLEENLKIFNERAKSWTSEQSDLAGQFIRGEKVAEEDVLRAFTGEDGMKDIKFLQQTRERYESDLPKWMKMALGPIESPFTRSAFTASNQEDLVMRAQAIRLLKDSGAIQSQADLAALRPSAINGRKSERWVQIPNDPSKFGSAAGKYAHPNYSGFLYYTETVKGFQNMIAKVLSPLAKTFKVANTVLSQGAWLSNLLGNMQGMAMSGAMAPSDLFRPGGVGEVFGASRDQWKDFLKNPEKVGTSKSGADWIRESVKYGILGTDFVSAEFRAFIDAAAKHSFPGERSKVTLTDYLQSWFDASKKGFRAGAKTYGGMDPFFKHANWLAGVKKGGVDIRTGQLVDREAAVDFLKGWGGDAKVLGGMSDAQLAERVKAGSARMIAESHPMPDRIGRIQRESARIADMTGALGVGDLFVRTSSEVLRTQLMALPRAFTRPGVARSLFEYGLLAGTVLGGATALKRQMGISPEAERKSYMGLPQQLRQFRPGAFALPIRPEAQGRLMYLDLGRFFDGIKYLGGDPGGRPLLEGLEESPGQMASIAAFNIAKTYMGLGNVGEDAVRDIFEKAGLLPPSVPDKATRQPGVMALADKMWKLASIGFAKQGVAAFNAMQGQPGQPGISPERAAAQFLTGGAIFSGGSNRDAAVQGQILQRQMTKEMKPSLTREGQRLGPFQEFSREQDRQQRLEKIQSIKQYRR